MAKVIAMASDLIVVEEHVICSALNWLATNKQLPDGTFKEDAPVIHEEMLVSHFRISWMDYFNFM